MEVFEFTGLDKVLAIKNDTGTALRVFGVRVEASEDEPEE